MRCKIKHKIIIIVRKDKVWHKTLNDGKTTFCFFHVTLGKSFSSLCPWSFDLPPSKFQTKQIRASLLSMNFYAVLL